MSKNTNALVDERIKYIKNLIKDGKPEFAQFESAKLVAQYPGNIMALCFMTYIFYIANDLRNSLRYARLAYSKITSDSSWQEIVSASNALLMVGEIEEANSVMVQLKLDEITDVGSLSYIAKHYGSLDQVEIAAKIFEKISDNQLDFHSRQMYGVAKLYMGKFDEARLEFEKAIDLNPLDGVSYNQLSVLQVAEKRDDRILSMKGILNESRLDAVNRAYVHFSLFNELEADNQLEEAWVNLQRANNVRRATVHQDTPHDIAGCQNIIEAFRQRPIHSTLSQSETTPIFIVGLPRTGTTLLEKILSSFDEVKPCGELKAFRRELEFAANTNFINPFDLGFCKNIAGFDFENIGNEYLRKNRWRHEGKKYFTDKEPSNYTYAGFIARAIPNARIIHIKRNPMDACFSNYKQFFGSSSFTYSYDLLELAEHYKLYSKMMQFWKEKIPESLLEISYESLVSNPDFHAERIRNFCGFDPQQKSGTQNDNYITSTLSAAQVRAPIHNKNINAWQRYKVQLTPLYEALQEYIMDYEKELGAELQNV